MLLTQAYGHRWWWSCEFRGPCNPRQGSLPYLHMRQNTYMILISNSHLSEIINIVCNVISYFLLGFSQLLDNLHFPSRQHNFCIRRIRHARSCGSLLPYNLISSLAVVRQIQSHPLDWAENRHLTRQYHIMDLLKNSSSSFGLTYLATYLQ